MVSNNIACFRDKLLISCAMQYFHVYFNDTIYPVSYIASNVKHMEMIGRNDGEKFYNDCEMDKQSWKWSEKKGGWEFSLENAKSLVQRVEESCRSTATAPISVSGGPDAREYHSVPHFFFLSPLYFFPYFSFLSLFLLSPSLSVLLFTVVTTADIRCYRTALLWKEFISRDRSAAL